MNPFGLEFQNSRCLFTEFANLIHFGRKFFFAERQTETRTDIEAQIVVQIILIKLAVLDIFQSYFQNQSLENKVLRIVGFHNNTFRAQIDHGHQKNKHYIIWQVGKQFQEPKTKCNQMVFRLLARFYQGFTRIRGRSM